MKAIMTIALLSTCFTLAVAQEHNQTVIINTKDYNAGQLKNMFFRYKDFTGGKVFAKDNTITDARMNYDQLSGEILFIAPAGDTLEFANPETLRLVIIGTDSFYFFAGKYLQIITHYPGINLASLQKLTLVGKDKKTAYGSYSAASSVNSPRIFTNANLNTGQLSSDERQIFRLNETYFISDKFNHFSPATKKNFYNLFFTHEKEIKNFVDSAKIKFYKKADLEQLLQYIQTLN